MTERDSRNWMREFDEFLSVPEERPPAEVRERVFARVHTDLHPSPKRVLAKVLFVHALVGSVTLFFCPQFGLSWGGSHGIMHLYMRFGPVVCGVACGVTFLGLSAAIAALVLRVEEVRWLRAHRVWPWALVVFLSLMTFRSVGSVAFEGFLLAWIAGAVAGAAGLTELAWRARLAYSGDFTRSGPL